MDKNKDNEIILAPPNVINCWVEVAEMAKTDKELLNNVYREISEAMGTDTAMEMYRLFKGQQISFPVRFFNPECIKQKIVEEYDGTNIRHWQKSMITLKKPFGESLRKAWRRDRKWHNTVLHAIIKFLF